MANRLGARSTYLAAVAMFTLGSLLSAFVPDITSLAAARFFQGIGGGAMVSIGRLILVRSVAKHDLVAALNWLMVPALIGPLIGSPIGGYLTSYLSWHWIFLINVPIGLASLILVMFFVREPPRAAVAGRFDLIGLLHLAALLATLILSLNAASRSAWGYAGVLMVVSLGCATAFHRHASGIASPIVDMRLIVLSPFGNVMLIGSLSRLSINALQFLVTVQLQIVLGFSAAATGTLMVMAVFGALLARIANGAVLQRSGFRGAALHTAFWATLLAGVQAFFSPSWPFWLIGLVIFAGAFVRSLQLFICGALAYDGIPQQNLGDATTLFVLSQQLMISLGVALAVAVLALIGASDAPDAMQLGFAILIMTAISAIAIPVTARLRQNVGADMLGARGVA
jgi:hypothetical protein